VEFVLLGPVEVRSGGVAVSPGGVRQRALLALLLLHVGEVVSRDRLIDELWGDTSPDSAGHRLEVLVSRLRKTVGLGEVLVARPGGYALEVDPDSVDAPRFGRLVAEGRRAYADGKPAEAAAVLGEALGLWRGAALGELAYLSFARLEAERLEELRLAAITARASLIHDRRRGADRRQAGARRTRTGDRRAAAASRPTPDPGANRGTVDARSVPV
jgi:DNA-binding SARP family transcriptional activator